MDQLMDVPAKDLSKELHSPNGAEVPGRVVELLLRMLRFSPEERPSVEEIMAHPLFEEHFSEDDRKVCACPSPPFLPATHAPLSHNQEVTHLHRPRPFSRQRLKHACK